MLKISSYDFDLPEELIAQRPADERDASRLLVVERSSGAISHRSFKDIVEYIGGGDCLAINSTKVVPARVFGRKKTGGRVEMLFTDFADGAVQALVKPGVPEGESVFFDDGIVAQIGRKRDDGASEIVFNKERAVTLLTEKHGVMPLPPYIKRRNAGAKIAEEDRRRYQTVYAEKEGSIAAPTAGLHFTEDILAGLESRGTAVARIVLHVGLGTFKSVRTQKIDEHKMLPERFSLDEKAASKINDCKKKGGKIFSVGTTTTRTLETLADERGFVKPSNGETSLYIYPGHKFRAVDCLVTNFHLPRSTPLFLACAFCGRELLFEAYRLAIKERYRFFSYGDAMLIL